MTATWKIAAAGAALLLSFAAPVAEAAEGDWLVRGRLLHVTPDEKSTLSLGGSAISGSARVGDATVPELDFTYFVTDHVGLELILATTNHEVSARGTPLGDVDLGDVWLLPPTLSVQYHLAPGAAVSPYVGAGLNYTIFYGEDSGAAAGIDYDDGFGIALQAGVDIALGDRWVFNIDVKKLWLDTSVTVDAGLSSPIGAKVDLDPLILGIGLGYRF